MVNPTTGLFSASSNGTSAFGQQQLLLPYCTVSIFRLPTRMRGFFGTKRKQNIDVGVQIFQSKSLSVSVFLGRQSTLVSFAPLKLSNSQLSNFQVNNLNQLS